MSDYIPFPGNLQTTSPTQGVSTSGMQVGQGIKVEMLVESESGMTRNDDDTDFLVAEDAATYLGLVGVSGPRQGDQNVVAGPFTASYGGNADPNDVTYNWEVSPTALFSQNGNTMTFIPVLETDYTITCTFVDSNSSDSGKQASMAFQTNIVDDPGTDPPSDENNTFTVVDAMDDPIGARYTYAVGNTDSDGAVHTELDAAGVWAIRIKVDLNFNPEKRLMVEFLNSSFQTFNPVGDWKLQLVNLTSDPGVEPIFVNGSTLLNEDDWKLFGVGDTFALGPGSQSGLDLMVHRIDI